MRLFARRFKNKKTASQIKRKPNQKSNEKRTHEQHTKTSKNRRSFFPKWLPRGGVEGSGGLLAAGSAPRASQNQLRRLSGPQKNCWRAPGGGQEEIWRSISPPLKTHTPPTGGGHGVLRPSVLEHFSLKSLLAPRRGAKIEGPGFQGATLGVGGRS